MLSSPSAAIETVFSLWRSGRHGEALSAALALEPSSVVNAEDAHALGALLRLSGELRLSQDYFEIAHKRHPERRDYIFDYAQSLTAAGTFGEAGDLLRRLVLHDPTDTEALFSLAYNHRQSEDDNALEALQKALVSTPAENWRVRVQLHYAAGKTLEDLKQYGDAFRQYQSGAALQRGHASYDFDADRASLRLIAETFSSPAVGAYGDPRPIFVVGLPRSGTTLVERVLTAHSQVGSVGESTSFTHALTAALRHRFPDRKLDRSAAIAGSLALDFSELGRAYVNDLGVRTRGMHRFVDKMPLNFLYIGLIRRALPDAKIVIVRRNALDNCFAMFSTLFRAAYPFSYDLRELAGYYAGFDALMRHWRDLEGAALHFIQYENLVRNFEPEVRALLAYAGLEWEDQCLAFHDNAAPTATASAAQVRQPIYDSSIGRWRRFQDELLPLRQALADAGIELAPD